MKKYLRHVASKYRFPTRIIRRGSVGKADLHIGAIRALQWIEGNIGRKLRKGFRARHTRTQWVWLEYRGTPFSQQRGSEIR